VDVIGSAASKRRANCRLVCFTGKDAQLQRQPGQADFTLLRLPKAVTFTFVMNTKIDSRFRPRLGERAKIPLEFEKGAPDTQAHIKDQLLQIHEQITQRWQNALANDAAGRSRLFARRVRGSREAVPTGLRPTWDDTVNWAKSKGHELPLVERAGLILRKEGGNHHYDRFATPDASNLRRTRPGHRFQRPRSFR
jgi:hypothetical protein